MCWARPGGWPDVSSASRRCSTSAFTIRDAGRVLPPGALDVVEADAHGDGLPGLAAGKGRRRRPSPTSRGCATAPAGDRREVPIERRCRLMTLSRARGGSRRRRGRVLRRSTPDRLRATNDSFGRSAHAALDAGWNVVAGAQPLTSTSAMPHPSCIRLSQVVGRIAKSSPAEAEEGREVERSLHQRDSQDEGNEERDLRDGVRAPPQPERESNTTNGTTATTSRVTPDAAVNGCSATTPGGSGPGRCCRTPLLHVAAAEHAECYLRRDGGRHGVWRVAGRGWLSLVSAAGAWSGGYVWA